MSPASFDGAHATIRSAWTHVDGLRIHARTGGRTGAARVRDVVLVHGVVVSSRYMVPLALELGRDFRVHAPDLPGFGLSEHPTDVLGVADLAQTLVAWLDHCRIERPALVANSFGCQIALHALARRPNRFDCAVLQGPTFDRRAGPLRQGLRWLATGLREQPSLSDHHPGLRRLRTATRGGHASPCPGRPRGGKAAARRRAGARRARRRRSRGLPALGERSRARPSERPTADAPRSPACTELLCGAAAGCCRTALSRSACAAQAGGHRST